MNLNSWQERKIFEMNFFQKIFDFYINSSIHVGLAVVALAVITALHFDIPADIALLGFVFFGTITGYNFVKYAGVAKLHHRSLASGLKIILIFSLFCFFFLIWFCFLVEVEILIWTAIFGTFTLLYALPVFSKKRNLRSISGIKIFIIAFVWAGVTVILPVVNTVEILSLDVLLELFQRFLLVLVWILPFEIRDLKYDLKQLGTLPQRVGVTGTKVVGLILLSLVVLTEFFKSTYSSATILSFVLMALLSGILVWKAKERQSAYYASFWVEGIPIFWLLFLLIFKS
ncbi:hypothetical protein [Salinimicrobium soli]|uniref:hypothetical protein n=1 Tax=Salinimicrobium soli TaxID=1254399 RepID=UPI003AB0465A